MKWTYSIQNKMVASGALFTLCVLVLFSNNADRNHTRNVKQAISTLYEDRLIVEDYILKMTIDIYEMKQALQASGRSGESVSKQIDALLTHIEGLSTAYKKTRFTESEDITFSALLTTLNEFESSASAHIDDRLKLADRALAQLSELSSIQLEESKSIMKHAEQLYISGEATTQFAFVVTIVILLVLQALVFASKTLRDNRPPADPQLN